MFKNKRYLILFCSLLLVGCGNYNNQALETNAKSQVELRSVQSHAYDITNKTLAMRNVIATLQDLGFVLDKADSTLGIISATKFVYNTPLKMSISVRKKNEKQLLIRANAQYNLKSVEDPVLYQDFFNALSTSMFIKANSIG